MINENGYNNDAWPAPAQKVPGSNPCGCTQQELNYLNFAKNILIDTEPQGTKSAEWQYIEALEKKCEGQGVDK